MRTLLGLLFFGLLPPAGLGAAEEDWRWLHRPVSSSRSVELGISRLTSGGGYGWLLEDEGLADGGAELDAESRRDLLEFPHRDADVESLAADALRQVRVEITVTGPDGRRVSGEIRARPGRWASLEQTRLLALVGDLDVEIACDNSGGIAPSAIADPITRHVADGLAVDVRPFLVDGGRVVAFEAVVQAGTIETPVHLYHPEARFLGAFAVPRYRGGVIAFSGATVPGKAVTAELSTPEGRLEVSLTFRPEGRPGSGRLRLHHAGILLLPPLRPVLVGSTEGAWERTWKDATAALFTQTVGGPVTEEWDLSELLLPGGFDIGVRRGASGTLAVAAPRLLQVRITRGLAGLTAARARPVLLELRAMAGERPVATARLSALPGRTAAFRLGEDRMVHADDDVEVGCYINIADPIVRPVFSGLLGFLTPRVDPGGGVVIDLDVRLQALAGEPEKRSLDDGVNGSVHQFTLRRAGAALSTPLPVTRPVLIPMGRDSRGAPLTLEIDAADQFVAFPERPRNCYPCGDRRLALCIGGLAPRPVGRRST